MRESFSGSVADQFMRDVHCTTRGKVPTMVYPGNGDVFSCGADRKVRRLSCERAAHTRVVSVVSRNSEVNFLLA